MEQRQDLDALPPSTDEFWEGADVNTNLVPQPAQRGKYYFIRKSPREAQCKNTGFGLYIDPGDTIRRGHIYDHKGKKII